MPAKSSGPTDLIYQLKITLRNFRPPIWRRVLVPGMFTLPKLHQVIQIAMGWSDSHLHRFLVDGIYYSAPFILIVIGKTPTMKIRAGSRWDRLRPTPSASLCMNMTLGMVGNMRL